MPYIVRVFAPDGSERSRETLAEAPTHIRVHEGERAELIDEADGSSLPLEVEIIHKDWDHDLSPLDE